MDADNRPVALLNLLFLQREPGGECRIEVGFEGHGVGEGDDAG
jgi:hypothetical protein